MFVFVYPHLLYILTCPCVRVWLLQRNKSADQCTDTLSIHRKTQLDFAVAEDFVSQGLYT